MSVLLETSLGDIVIDVETEQTPVTARNFIKLAKIGYYLRLPFHYIEHGFIAQTGDPTGQGAGGESIYGLLGGDKYFSDEICKTLSHKTRGCVSMATAGSVRNGSQFFITLADNLEYLDGEHTLFGHVTEGLDVLSRMNEVLVDAKTHRPVVPVLVRRVHVLDDPFDDPPGLQDLGDMARGRALISDVQTILVGDGSTEARNSNEPLQPEELERLSRRKEAQTHAVTLKLIGDLPDVDIKPPENVLFVCKLNPVTRDQDLALIFSRFGKIIKKTNQSLGYAFIEFESAQSCEEAYSRMNNVLIDDRRICIDFSQSVAKLRKAADRQDATAIKAANMESLHKPEARRREEREEQSGRRGSRTHRDERDHLRRDDEHQRNILHQDNHSNRHDDRDKHRSDDSDRNRYERDDRHRESAYTRNTSRNQHDGSPGHHRQDSYSSHEHRRRLRDDHHEYSDDDNRDDRNYHDSGKKYGERRPNERHGERWYYEHRDDSVTSDRRRQRPEYDYADRRSVSPKTRYG